MSEIVQNAVAADTKEVVVYFGTRADGIYQSVLDLESGKLTDPTIAASIKAPGFLAINQAGTRLYSLGNIAGTDDNVAAYEIGRDRKTLTFINSGNTGGGKPTHISLSRDEKTLLLAHYGGGSSVSMAVEEQGAIGNVVSSMPHQGTVGPNTERQDQVHPHWIGATPDNKFVLVPDLGTDEIVVYQFDSKTHSLERSGSGKSPAGAGPRHLKFHPDKPWVYVVNELSLTVSQFTYDAGVLSEVSTVEAVSLDETKTDCTGSEIRIHPSGRFLYAAVRGDDFIATFAIDPTTGQLTLTEREPVRGSWPRNFGVDPTGQFLLAAGAETNTISVFRIDLETGRLYFTREVINVPQSICVEFLQ